MYRRILIAVDSSAPAQIAAHSGLQLAKTLGSHVALVTVLAPAPAVVANIDSAERESSEHWKEAEQLLHRLSTGYKVEHFITDGATGDEIVLAAKSWHADLIVIGTHSRQGLSRLLLGSTAEHVVRHAPCPVLVARETPEVPTHHPLQL